MSAIKVYVVTKQGPIQHEVLFVADNIEDAMAAVTMDALRYDIEPEWYDADTPAHRFLWQTKDAYPPGQVIPIWWAITIPLTLRRREDGTVTVDRVLFHGSRV